MTKNKIIGPLLLALVAISLGSCGNSRKIAGDTQAPAVQETAAQQPAQNDAVEGRQAPNKSQATQKAQAVRRVENR